MYASPWQLVNTISPKSAFHGLSFRQVGYTIVRMAAIELTNLTKRFAADVVAVHRAPSVEAAESFADGYFDWVYIDGNHLYEFVKADLETYHRKVRTGGYIAGDDYGAEGWWEGGVTRAVDEFRRAGLCETVLIQDRQFLLQKV